MTCSGNRIAQIATLGFACVVVIAAASAFLRVHGYGAPVVPETVVDAVRGAHRIAAILAGLAIIALAVLAFERRGAGVDLAIVGTLLVLTAVLAWVGRSSAGAPHPAVAVTNLLGGFVLAGLLWWLRLRQSGRRTPSAIGSAALAVIVAQIALGAALSLTRVGPPILVAHAVLGLVFAGLCFRLRSAPLIVMSSAQVLLGGTMALTQLPFALVYSHNLLAVLLLVATIHALHRPRAA
jgi:heme A synthase